MSFHVLASNLKSPAQATILHLSCLLETVDDRIILQEQIDHTLMLLSHSNRTDSILTAISSLNNVTLAQ